MNHRALDRCQLTIQSRTNTRVFEWRYVAKMRIERNRSIVLKKINCGGESDCGWCRGERNVKHRSIRKTPRDILPRYNTDNYSSRAKVKSLETQRQERCNAIKPFTVNQAHSRSTDLSMSLRISSVVMPSLPRAFTEIEKHTARLTQRLNYYDNT